MARLHIHSALEDLKLHYYAVETSCPGRSIYQVLEENSVLPGVVLLSPDGQFKGIISRRHFLESMSRAYGRELFLRRPISVLHRFIIKDVLKLSGRTLITDALEAAIARPLELLYEPIVVDCGSPSDNLPKSKRYYLIDIHNVLQAQSTIHQLTAQLLKQKTRSEMMQTEKMASLGKMMAGVAHEIRNPVNFIWGNLKYLGEYLGSLTTLIQALEKEVGSPSPELYQLKKQIDLDFVLQDLPDVLQSMNTGTDRLRNLVTSLRTFSRLDEVKRDPTNIHHSLDSTLQILNNRLKEGITIHKRYAVNLPEIPCYSGQIGQVFMNLLSNAIDALLEHPISLAQVGEFSETNTKGLPPTASKTWEPCITITTELCDHLPPDAPPIKPDAIAPKSLWVSICIRDNGPGIPPALQRKVFDDFFTTKVAGQGTGLGLPITRQIVTEKHSGHLILRSPPSLNNAQFTQQGTEFEILLPTQAPKKPFEPNFLAVA